MISVRKGHSAGGYGRMLMCAAVFGFSVMTSFAQRTADYTTYVNPFVGTGGHGHTFPGATLPFGMVQLSPDTGVEGWDWCSGYHASDSSIMGFSHTHLSGTGGADYGDILLMPTIGKAKYVPGTKENPDAGYRSRFKHANETATPGYYSVFLDDYKVKAELTATLRTGMHRYTFPKSNESNIILDLVHGISDNATNLKLSVLSGTRIEGYRFSKGWAGDQRLYFAMELSRPYDNIEIVKDDKVVSAASAEGSNVKASFKYTTRENESIVVKVAISSVSCQNAWDNMKAENNGFDFDAVKDEAKKIWNKELSKIEVEGGTENDKVIFYSALYHTKIHPNIFQDVNGEYRGMDMKVHKVEGRSHYTLFSLWDTFRALHPLLSITDTKYNNDFVKSMVAKYSESGRLPVWELWSNETNTMIGYHSIPVIADAILKGYYTGDVELAYKAMVASAMADGQGLKDYRHFGYIPREKEANSVSKTLEYAYDDYAIAQVAKKLGKMDNYKTFTLRSYSYRNMFDSSVKFMRGRDENGVWNPKFDPMAITLFGSGDFTEGNSWHYSFFAPHDINGLIDLYGGNRAYTEKLNEMFEQEAVNDNEHAHDVTGLIGQYAQGNEPSHHVIYTYNFALRPDRTQALVRKVLHEMYTSDRDGYCGNEDTGQMSAWYVLSAMGFYPMNPVGGQYVIGSPLFSKVTIHLENGKTFVVEAKNNAANTPFIKSATLNGKPYGKTFISYSDIVNGGNIVFEMSDKSQTWGTAAADAPVSFAYQGKDALAKPLQRAFMPYSVGEKTIFNEKMEVKLVSETPGVKIYYTLDGSKPTKKSKLYTKPFILNKSTTLKAISSKKGFLDSDIKTIELRKAVFNDGTSLFPKITTDTKLGTSYNPGIAALLDGKLGSNNFRDGEWLGIQGDDLRAIIDMGVAKQVSQVTLNFIQNTGSWIFPPKAIKIFGSKDGVRYTELASENYPILNGHADILVVTKSLKVNAKVQYLKVVVETTGLLPSWHLGFGKPSYVFVDEIIVE